MWNLFELPGVLRRGSDGNFLALFLSRGHAVVAAASGVDDLPGQSCGPGDLGRVQASGVDGLRRVQGRWAAVLQTSLGGGHF